MENEIKVGDFINYGFYANIKVVGIDDFYYYLQDKGGNKRKVYKFLVDKWVTSVKRNDGIYKL